MGTEKRHRAMERIHTHSKRYQKTQQREKDEGQRWRLEKTNERGKRGEGLDNPAWPGLSALGLSKNGWTQALHIWGGQARVTLTAHSGLEPPGLDHPFLKSGRAWIYLSQTRPNPWTPPRKREKRLGDLASFTVSRSLQFQSQILNSLCLWWIFWIYKPL